MDLNFFFFIFSFFSIICSFFVIISKNPLHSIIFLILVFCNVVFILLLQEIEFLSMVLLIVYIGAIAVLFLFVVYMLNIKVIDLNEFNWQFLIGIFFSLFFFFLFIVYIFLKKKYLFVLNFLYENNISNSINFFNLLFDINNLKILSIVIYNDNYLIFLVISLILLIAMIGSIILTSKKTFFLKEQLIFQQNERFIKKRSV